jgi:hypothetical protein
MTRYTITLVALFLGTSALPAADLSQASWSPPKTITIKQQVELYLAGRQLSDAAHKEIDALWSDAEIHLPPEEALRRLAVTFAAADPAAKEVVDFVEQTQESPLPKAFAILSDENAPPLVRNNLKLLYGAYLAQNNLFDEAAEQLDSLKPADVVDPASLLFYQAVAAHRLLKKDQAEPLLSQLLENEANLPKRYATVARLMQHDLEPLKPDSLDEVSRMMDDVRRRLDLGRAGKKVRDEEAEIIAKLDKKIEDMQKQQQEQQQQQQQQQDKAKQAPSQAAEKSQAPQDIHASDEVDPKDLKKANWGNLPPKARQQALQQISRDLPSHFRDTIEEYFKRLAQDGNE